MKIQIAFNSIHSKEKEYILSVLFADILGLSTSYHVDDSLEHYEIILPNEKNPIVFLNKDYKIIRSFDKSNTLTFGEIADLLNEYGITNRSHKQWTAGSVNRIFKNNH